MNVDFQSHRPSRRPGRWLPLPEPSMRREAAACFLALLAFGRAGWAQAVGAGRATPSTSAGQRPSFARLADADEVRRRLGLVPEYEDFAGIESVKVAVLDYGFEGVGGGRPYLPRDAEVVEHY